jgi:fatty acid desaturase
VGVELKKTNIAWYRSPVKREVLDALNQRSDWKGLQQTLGHLGLLLLTGAASWYAAGQQAWLLLIVFLFLHGTFYAFLLNGFHELVHKTVFRTKFLNTFFLYVFSFIGSLNPFLFWASHQEHHKYTLHAPDDLEVVLPVKLTLKDFLKYSFVNPWGMIEAWKGIIRLSRGQLKGQWEHALFPESNVEGRRRLFGWARILLAGHALIVLAAILTGWWMLPVLITLAPYYGGWLLFLCNNTQHIGLQDDVPDYRLCCRTISLPAFVSFVYWRMNYHTEHHMYAAVPCYNLKTLHEAIADDLPPTRGLIDAWREIIAILDRQKAEPGYEFVPQLRAGRGGTA